MPLAENQARQGDAVSGDRFAAAAANIPMVRI
jgi:hypothetical protein